MIKKILIGLTAIASLVVAPSALAEVMPGADVLGGDSFETPTAWTAQPSEEVAPVTPDEAQVVDVVVEELEVVEATPVAAEPKAEAPATVWDASEWTVAEEPIEEAPTVNPTLQLEPVAPAADEPEVPASVEEPSALAEVVISEKPDVPIVVSFDEEVATVESTPAAVEEVETVVEEPETASTVAQVQYPEATTPISPSPLPNETGYDRSVEVWAEAQTDFDGESMVTSTVTIPVGETGEIKVGGAVGNSSSEGESTDWNSQSIAVIGQIAEWDRGELYGHVTLNRSAFSGATSDGAYSWDGESFDVWTGVTAEHRPDNFTLRLDAGISPVTGEGDIQGDATWHIGSDVHLTGSIGTRGRSLQIEATPTILGVPAIIGANTVRPAGEEQSYRTVYYGVDLGAFRITHNTRNELNVGVGFTF
jgi:hypothetical protein